MAKRIEDRFANLASAKVVQSAANTLTFVEMNTGISLGAGIGILIDQIDYYPTSAGIADMTTSGDQIDMAWTTSNVITDIQNVSDRRVIDLFSFFRFDLGTAASGALIKEPFSKQYFPPLIIAAPKLYLALASSGLAGVATLRSRLHYRYIELTDKEYLEIAETFILVG